VTGSRAEFGLMRRVLEAIGRGNLQIVVTGMHLDRRHGKTIEALRKEWKIDAVAPWPTGPRAEAVGVGITGLAKIFQKLEPQIVLVVGDRVEAFAAAAAAHLSDIAVAHVHGGDRALGQTDDTLRHAITKLSHIHFPATRTSAERLRKMGEDGWRIHRFGSPGVDGIRREAASKGELRKEFPLIRAGKFALVVLHPVDADEAIEFQRARMVVEGVKRSGLEKIIIIYPNNDPGSRGIIRCWESLRGDHTVEIRRDVARPIFLGLLREAAMLVGNSSAGIIEAASFRTPVIDIGPRQEGRERCKDVRNVPYRESAIAGEIKRLWNSGRPRRGRYPNPYGGENASGRIAGVLNGVTIDGRLLRKIISY
jgi:GDP/UDP-N,N'-diacetylbacillosamine 2-epimerase (hydrolysing)